MLLSREASRALGRLITQSGSAGLELLATQRVTGGEQQEVAGVRARSLSCRA